MMGVKGFLSRICPGLFYKGDSPKIILASVASGTMARGNTQPIVSMHRTRERNAGYALPNNSLPWKREA
jgi:hypothetical protein